MMTLMPLTFGDGHKKFYDVKIIDWSQKKNVHVALAV